MADAPTAAPVPAGMDVDAERSQAGFRVRTRWNQALEGRFTGIGGSMRADRDGRYQVHLSLDSGSADLADNAVLTARLRGKGFFDAELHPRLHFVSDPLPAALMHTGGELGGTVTIRDITRRERFRIQPAGCERPGLDCPVRASGSVRRRDYGMRRMPLLLRDEVIFDLSIRLQPLPGAGAP